MILSSRSGHRFSQRWGQFEGPVLAEQGPQDVDASPGQSDERLDVPEAGTTVCWALAAARASVAIWSALRTFRLTSHVRSRD